MIFEFVNAYEFVIIVQFSNSEKKDFDMKHIFKQFLETSTIHGLSWISSTKKYARLFWTMVIIGGFTGAFILIQEAFQVWEKSPISTTVETLPISHLTFPNVTVCPPKNSYLNLNYDMMKSENISLDKKTRDDLYKYALDVIQNEFFEELMRNLSKIEEQKRYYNWYYGFSEISYPFFDVSTNQLKYQLKTIALTGNVSTKDFGEFFYPNKGSIKKRNIKF